MKRIVNSRLNREADSDFILISRKNSISIMILGNKIVNSDWNGEKVGDFPKLILN